jgi:hypothetical protein
MDIHTYGIHPMVSLWTLRQNAPWSNFDWHLIFRENMIKVNTLLQHSVDNHACGLQHMIPWWTWRWKCPLIKPQLRHNFCRKCSQILMMCGNMVWTCAGLDSTARFLDGHWDESNPWFNFDLHIIFAENWSKLNTLWQQGMEIHAYKLHRTIPCEHWDKTSLDKIFIDV